MTIDRVAMKELLEKGSDQDLFREMAPHTKMGPIMFSEQARSTVAGIELLTPVSSAANMSTGLMLPAKFSHHFDDERIA